MDFRLTKRHRLLGSQEFSQVFNQAAHRLSARNLLVLATSNTQGCPRLGLVISKKNAGCSVARNRVKRLCRESFRLRRNEFAMLDIVVLARPGVSKLNNEAIVAMLNSLFDQLCQKQKRVS